MSASLRMLISSGPTREPIDAVRFISNYSTGTMGQALAAEALRRGHRVTVVSGPVNVSLPRGARVIWVERAEEMREALRRELARADALIMAAAVCDFQPRAVAKKKLHRQGSLTLQLQATPDVVEGLPRRAGQLLVGFAVETNAMLARTRAKLKAKRLDLIVGQRASASGEPFGDRRVTAVLLDAEGGAEALGRISKPQLAKKLFEMIEQRLHGDVAKWSKAAVCKTAIHRFESGRRLQFAHASERTNGRAGVAGA